MSSFTSQLKVAPLDDGESWVLLEPFTYHVGSYPSEIHYTVPKGFITDFASSPKFVWWLVPPWGKYGKASVVHDYLIRAKPAYPVSLTRKYVDDIFLEAMLVLKVPRWKAQLIYYAVRLGSWYSWNQTHLVESYLLSEKDFENYVS